jgi:hypothetical protein
MICKQQEGRAPSRWECRRKILGIHQQNKHREEMRDLGFRTTGSNNRVVQQKVRNPRERLCLNHSRLPVVMDRAQIIALRNVNSLHLFQKPAVIAVQILTEFLLLSNQSDKRVS